MAKYQNRNFEDLDITKAELKELGEALQKEEFRKLLNDYVEEVTDPKNKALYEKEITELEKQRGVDITFVHPEAGYVIKSSIDGVQKAFVNICYNNVIDKPQSTTRVKNGVQGSDWTIPHIITPSRVDLDKKGQRCVVYDVVFNPLSLEIAKTNREFRSLLNDTAISAIEQAFGAKIDRNNLRFPKLDFKGPKIASVIRKKRSETLSNPDEEPLDFPNYPYKPLKSNKSPKVINLRRSQCEKNDQECYTTPEYIVKHRRGIDLQEFTYTQDAKMNAAIPSELVIEVNLPLLSSTEDAVLDVTSRTLSLVSERPSKYKLELKLPYDVDEANGFAKFDKKAKKLIINLPVVQRKFDPSYFSRDDSGIESDPSHNRSSSDEDLSYSKVEVISDKVTESVGSSDTLRTSFEVSEKFLSESLHYTFPSYQINCNENCLILTLNVKNIDPSSVFHQYVLTGSGVHFKFSSLGAGCFPIHYAVCIQFPGFIINTSNLKVEVWDNNLIINMEVSSSENFPLNKYLIGPSPESLVPKYFTEREVGFKGVTKGVCINEVQENLSELSVEDKSTESSQSSERIELQTDRAGTGETLLPNKAEDPTENPVDVPSNGPVKKQLKVRTCSESNAHRPGSQFHRSILKKSRSLSESHSDEYTVWSSLDSSDISEDSSNQTTKKTVRFSDVIYKKVFRANSSILGQKHKNEKKARNRKKVARRRMSESENSEVSDYSDYSEVSDVSDLSEASDTNSDDQPDVPVQLPGSKRHRRRGSKNSRKNAATAKQNNFILSQD